MFSIFSNIQAETGFAAEIDLELKIDYEFDESKEQHSRFTILGISGSIKLSNAKEEITVVNNGIKFTKHDFNHEFYLKADMYPDGTYKHLILILNYFTTTYIIINFFWFLYYKRLLFAMTEQPLTMIKVSF